MGAVNIELGEPRLFRLKFGLVSRSPSKLGQLITFRIVPVVPEKLAANG
jgi:hypothetical protein